jgi:membrane associated rhomboid family serine protease
MSSYRPQEWQPEETAPGPQIALPPAIKALLIANGTLFAAQWLLQSLADFSLVGYAGLSPAMVANGAVWQLVTYMFLHGNLLHILFNMLALWMFGRELEYDWGSREFLKYYFICGIGAGLVTLVALWGNVSYTIGASGAVYGILLAFGMSYPNRYIYLWFLIPIKAKYFVILFGAIELLMSFTSTGDGVAHLTHLGGLAIGFVYLKLSGSRMRLPAPLAWLGRWRAQRKGRELRRRFDEHRELMEEVDRILDRINQVGYEGLTPEERDSLERASKRLSTEPQK